MTEKPRLPNIECPNEDHPAGNRFMEHVGTRHQRRGPDGSSEGAEHIAMFQCVKCRRVTTQPFDPEARQDG